MARGNAEEGVIVDEEIEDPPDLIDSGASEAGDTPTGEEPLAAEATAEDPPPDADSDDLDEELLPAERATAAPAAAAAPTEEPKPATAAPFTYKGAKGEHTLEGAQYYAGDGLYIPDAGVPQLKQLLATAAHHNSTWQREKREFARQLEQAQNGRNAKDVAADALMDLVFKDLGKLEDDNDVYEWAVNFRKNLPNYQLAIERKKLDHEREQFTRQQEPDPEEVEAQHSSVASSELTKTLDQIFNRPEFKILDDEDRKELRTRYGAKALNYLSQADRDYPEHNLKKGDYVFDGKALLEEVGVTAAIKTRAASNAEAARKAAEANRRKFGKPGAVARVAAPAADTPAPVAGQPRDGKGRFKNREEYEEWMRSHEE